VTADWAQSGVVALTGHPDGPPLVPPGRAASFAREVSSRLAAATTIAVDGAKLLSERAAFTGHHRHGTTSAGGACRLLPTADGWAAISCARPDDPLLLGALVGETLLQDPWPAVAAWLGEHTGDELVERAGPLGLAAGPVRLPQVARKPAPQPNRPAEGLLVVDFSALWAGPLCAHLLGLAGADVVKVETPQRPDGARRGNADFYRLLHAGHRAVALDPETLAGRAALAGLVEAADIVIEASRPRALARFGLDAEAAVDAGTTWVSITAYGREVDRIGFGDDVAAASGLVAYDQDGTPLFCGDALADPLTGLVAAELALSAPAGALVEVTMSEVVASTLSGNTPTAARREQGRWVVDTVPVAVPERRAVEGDAPAHGENTAEVLRERGIPLP
jgi:crotonobetainyl-CoA:carnitine CoA-transferase CaiB-like acyl-CoA transferase